jgi:hypothetical protein
MEEISRGGTGRGLPAPIALIQLVLPPGVTSLFAVG